MKDSFTFKEEKGFRVLSKGICTRDKIMLKRCEKINTQQNVFISKEK